MSKIQGFLNVLDANENVSSSSTTSSFIKNKKEIFTKKSSSNSWLKNSNSQMRWQPRFCVLQADKRTFTIYRNQQIAVTSSKMQQQHQRVQHVESIYSSPNSPYAYPSSNGAPNCGASIYSGLLAPLPEEDFTDDDTATMADDNCDSETTVSLTPLHKAKGYTTII